MGRKKRGKFYQYRILTVFLACLFLTACAGREKPGDEPDEESLQEAVIQIFPEEWKENGFRDGGEIPFRGLNDTGMPYHTVDYSEVMPDGPDFDVSYQRVINECNDESVFYIKSYRSEDGWKYYLQQYDIRSGELHDNLPVFQEEGLQGYIDCLCLTGDKELAAIFVSVNEKSTPQELRLITFDSSGENVENVLLDCEYRKSANGPMMVIQNFLYDGSYFYLINYQESGLQVFDREGKKVFQEMSDVLGDSYYTAACSAPDGSVIASMVDLKNRKTDLFYLQGEKKKHMGEILGTSHKIFAMGRDGSFYFFENDCLIKWDTSTGEKTILLYSGTEGVDLFCLSAVTFSDNGRILLHCWNREETLKREIQICSGEEIEIGEDRMVFAIVDQYPEIYYLALPTEYSKRHPESKLIYQTHTGDIDSYRTRVMADILSGKGPDLLLVRNEDARSLYENNALLDLMEYLPPELKENIFPSVLTRGTVDGKLIGLDPNMQGYVILVSNAVWERDGWTIEDVVGLVDERKPQYLYSGIKPGRKYNPEEILTLLFTALPEKSSFLDLEAGTCDFENGNFIRLLEICKEYGEKPAPEEDRFYEVLRTGDCLFTCVSVSNMQWFSQDMKPLEKICHFVGVPGQEGYGFSRSNYMLVVNANTKHRDAVLKCLWSLFSVKAQQQMSHFGPVREDLVRESVLEKGTNMLTKNKPGFDTGDGGVHELEPREDGSSFVEEYIAALKGLEVRDSRSNAVVDIVESEAGLYFEGVRTAEQTAAIIQNRVQLYLNENR